MAPTKVDSITESENSKHAAGQQHGIFQEDDLNRIATIDIENYHGLTPSTILVYCAILLIGFGQLLNLVGSGAFARYIAAAVGGGSETVWLSQGIVILTVILGPVVSQASDYWGRKWFLVLLTACGAVGSIIVARATSMGMAIAGECILGVSYGAQPLLYAVASEILPRRWRPAAQGGINAALGLGGIVGLLAGSTLVGNYVEGFRIFWYIETGVLALATLICFLVYNPPPRAWQLSLTTGEKLRRLDWVGLLLLTIGSLFFIIALSWAENPYDWTDVHVLAFLLVGIVVIGAFAAHQTFFKKDGLFHHGLFKTDRNFAIALFVIFVDGLAFFAANNYYAFEVSVLWETDSLKVGLHFCIAFFAAVVSSIVISIYSSIRKTVRAPVVLSFTMFVIFYALMASANLNSATASWAYPILLGLGIGFSLTCLVTIAQLSAPPALIAISTGLLISVRSLGASIALSICSAIFNSTIASNLGSSIAAQVLPLGLSPDVLPQFIGALADQDQAALVMIPGVTPQIIGAGVLGLQQGYLLSFRGVWIFACVMSAVATLAACFFVDPAKTMNMHVDAPLEADTPEERETKVEEAL